ANRYVLLSACLLPVSKPSCMTHRPNSICGLNYVSGSIEAYILSAARTPDCKSHELPCSVNGQRHPDAGFTHRLKRAWRWMNVAPSRLSHKPPVNRDSGRDERSENSAADGNARFLLATLLQPPDEVFRCMIPYGRARRLTLWRQDREIRN